MGENLNYDAEGSKCYSNSDANCAQYGRLYDWATAMNGASSSDLNPSEVQGVCPVGWHIPSDDEWTTLTDYVSGAATAGMKLKSKTGWFENTGTDDYDFSALPGGVGYSDGGFINVGYHSFWWSATENNASNAWRRNIEYGYDNVSRRNESKTRLFSVRCVED
jgi:uncharacterized protein (TIGR02145 family)